AEGPVDDLVTVDRRRDGLTDEQVVGRFQVVVHDEVADATTGNHGRHDTVGAVKRLEQLRLGHASPRDVDVTTGQGGHQLRGLAVVADDDPVDLRLVTEEVRVLHEHRL